MPSFSPLELSTKDRHTILLGAVGPRPIALVSTVDEYGTPNLSPYSFFNIFSSNPPTVIFLSETRKTTPQRILFKTHVKKKW